MTRWIRRIGLALLAVLAVLAGFGIVYQRVSERRDLAESPAPGRMVDVGGHRLHLQCLGTGVPTVILDAGLGDTSFAWRTVQPDIGKFTQVCAYDRAGQGYSDPGPTPRTSAQVAQEVSRLLAQSGISSAVVAVGASLGGLNMRLLATTYPDRVAGLVLVDASHEDQRLDMPPFARLVPIAGQLGLMRLFKVSLGRDYPGTSFRRSRYRALYDEVTHIPDSAAEVRASRRVLNIPVVVVTAGKNLSDQWRQFQEDQLRLSARSCQLIAERSGHVIQLGQPERVVQAIRATIQAIRSNTTPVCA